MTTSRLRLIVLATVVAALSGPSIAAQTMRPDRPAPAPPPLEQRFERPDTRGPATKVRTEAMRDLLAEQEFRFYRPVFNLMHDYTLKAGDTVRGIRSVLADVRVEGRVYDDVVVILGKVTLAPTAVIEGSLVVIGGNVSLEQGATVGHDFVVVGGAAETPDEFRAGGEHVVMGSVRLGDALRAFVPWLTRGLLWGRLIVPELPWVWAVIGLSLLIGVALNHVFARQVGACADTLSRRPLSAFFMGLLVLLLSGPLLAILAASVIGLAVVPFAIAGLVVAGILGKIGVARSIGRSVMTGSDGDSRFQALRSYLIGFVVIMVAYAIPVLGILTWAMVGAFGLGAATMTFAATLRRERPTPAPKAPVQPPPVTPLPVVPPPVRPTPFDVAAESMASEGAPPPPVQPQAEPARAAVPGPMGDLLWYPRASFLDRVAAFALDVVLIAVASAFLQSAFWFRWGGDDGGFMFVVLAYIIGFTAWKGTTLGGIICSLRVVRTNGGELRFIDALVRGLSSIFSIAALGIGCFWMLNDPEKQMWHDKIAGTAVVKVPREVVLA